MLPSIPQCWECKERKMEEKIGYSLINSSNTEVQYWGNLVGVVQSAPSIITISNSSIHSPDVNVPLVGGYKLVERWVNYDPSKQTYLKNGETITFDGTKTVITYQYRSPTQAELLNYSANSRYQKEISGVSLGNNTIFTDRQSQAMITGIVSLMQIFPNTVINFKTAEGFISANASIVLSIAGAVAYHIQYCFSLENAVSANITSNVITSFTQIDSIYE